jgi:thioester reductase-like protein
MSENSIKKFYEDKEIFVTGGSGFLGRAIIEKLLRTCDVRKIYVLLRPKKGMGLEQRMQNLQDNCVFDVVRKSNPNFHQKLEIIEGDCMDLKLGIKDKDLEKLKNVSIIFHSAASIRFDDPLQKAILLNTRGTREVCNLAKSLKNLESLCHVSTAYVNPLRKEMAEGIYETSFDWRQYIKFAENLENQQLEVLTNKLTENARNTYVFTKNLAEHVVLSYKREHNLPVTIVRPSIITCSEQEPYPGWMDPYNGPIMFLV